MHKTSLLMTSLASRRLRPLAYSCAIEARTRVYRPSAIMSISSQMQPKLSEGQDESQVIKDAEELLEREWQLDDNSMGLRKMFFFKSYTKALVCLMMLQDWDSNTELMSQDFVQVVGIRSKSKNHHPVMIVVRLCPWCTMSYSWWRC